MSEILANLNSVFDAVRCDFSELWKTRLYGHTLELISPYTTLGGNLISVFLTMRNGQYVVSDGANLHNVAQEASIDIEDRKRLHLGDVLNLYRIRETYEPTSKKVFRYKSTEDVAMLSSYVFDMIHFQEAILNALDLETLFDLNEDEATKKFSTRVKDVLRAGLQRDPEFRRRYAFYTDEKLNAYRFNVSMVDKTTDSLWLGMCIYSSNYVNFSSAVYRAEFGFNHVRQSGLRQNDHLNLAVVRDSMPNELVSDSRVPPLTAAIRGWEDVWGVKSYSINDLERADIARLWARVA